MAVGEGGWRKSEQLDCAKTEETVDHRQNNYGDLVIA